VGVRGASGSSRLQTFGGLGGRRRRRAVTAPPGPRRRPGTTKGPDAEASGPFDQSWSLRSLDDLGDLARADRTATLADREAEALLHGDRLDELHRHVGGVARHDHLGALGQRDDAGDVRRTEVELPTVVRVEGVVTATLVLRQDVRRALELRVRGDRARGHDDLAALDVLTLRATKQEATVLTGPRLVELLVEHLDTR